MTQLSRERLEELANRQLVGAILSDEIAEMARRLLAVEGQELGICPKCNNTGLTDSGGVQPWGEAIQVPCDCSLPDTQLSQLVHDLNIDGHHRLANVILDLIDRKEAAPQPAPVAQPVQVPFLLIAELLEIAKNAANEADECAHFEHNDDSECHTKAIADWQRRAAMLAAEPVSQPYKLPDDTKRMDWLVSKTVNVREPMVYGSHSLFWSQAITDENDEYHATKLREQIDAAMAEEQAAAPQ